MLIENATMAGLQVNIQGVYWDIAAQQKAPDWFKQLFWIVQSTTRKEVIGFMKGLPGFREWVSERRVNNLAEYAIEVAYKKWESTVSINRMDVEDDRFNIILPQIAGLPVMYTQHFMDYALTLLPAGSSTVCYDGANFFDTSHPNTGPVTTYRNVTDQAFSATEWVLANNRASVINASDTVQDSGLPRSLSVHYDWIFYAPNAENDVRTVFGAERNANGSSNIYFGEIPPERRVRVDQWGGSQRWFLFDFSKIAMSPAFRPLLLDIRKGLEFVPFDKPTDWTVFSNNVFVYGQNCMDNATYLMPEFAYASTIA